MVAETTQPTLVVDGEDCEGTDHECNNDHGDGDDYCEEIDDESPTLFRCSGVDTDLADGLLEDCIASAIRSGGRGNAGNTDEPNGSLSTTTIITLLEKDYNGETGTILFCVNGGGNDTGTTTPNDDDFVLQQIRGYLSALSSSVQEGAGEDDKGCEWIKDASSAFVEVVDEEEEDFVEYITEEEAYQLWLEQNRCEGGDLAGDGDDEDPEGEEHLVSSPDGGLVRPTHHRSASAQRSEERKDEDAGVGPLHTTTTAQQLERDPGLFEFDNVPRVHYSGLLEHFSGERERNDSSRGSSTSSPELWRDFGSQPIIIYGFSRTGPEDDDNNDRDDDHKDLVRFRENLRETIRKHGNATIVRTGNRETLVKNGFHNSKPATLLDIGVVASAVRDESKQDETTTIDGDGRRDIGGGCDGTIIFNPIHEMPAEFRSGNVLGRWVNTTGRDETEPDPEGPPGRRGNVFGGGDFPNKVWHHILDHDDEMPPKFTLCIANEGFGIGMHKHGPALFFLTEGRKKWYMSHPDPIDELIREAAETTSTGESSTNNKNRSVTHPGFYREHSTHKCLQQPGELLLVPNLWYHEIYNLSSPTIGIQALADALPVPGDLRGC